MSTEFAETSCHIMQQKSKSFKVVHLGGSSGLDAAVIVVVLFASCLRKILLESPNFREVF